MHLCRAAAAGHHFLFFLLPRRCGGRSKAVFFIRWRVIFFLQWFCLILKDSALALNQFRPDKTARG